MNTNTRIYSSTTKEKSRKKLYEALRLALKSPFEPEQDFSVIILQNEEDEYYFESNHIAIIVQRFLEKGTYTVSVTLCSKISIYEFGELCSKRFIYNKKYNDTTLYPTGDSFEFVNISDINDTILNDKKYINDFYKRIRNQVYDIIANVEDDCTYRVIMHKTSEFEDFYDLTHNKNIDLLDMEEYKTNYDSTSYQKSLSIHEQPIPDIDEINEMYNKGKISDLDKDFLISLVEWYDKCSIHYITYPSEVIALGVIKFMFTSDDLVKTNIGFYTELSNDDYRYDKIVLETVFAADCKILVFNIQSISTTAFQSDNGLIKNAYFKVNTLYKYDEQRSEQSVLAAKTLYQIIETFKRLHDKISSKPTKIFLELDNIHEEHILDILDNTPPFPME